MKPERFENTEHPNIKLRKESGQYYFRGTVEGRFIERSLKTTSYSLAKDRAKKVIASAMGADVGTGLSVQKRHRFSEVFDLVIKIQSTKDKRTLEQAELIINRRLRPWFEQHCPFLDKMERSFEEVWADYLLHERQKKARKFEHDRRYLVTSLIRAFHKGWIKKLFEKENFHLNEVTDPIGKYMSDEEIGRILTATHEYPKLKLQVMLAVYMGMRLSEILHLRTEEIDLNRKEINLDPRRLKIRRPREVPIPIADDVYALLKSAHSEAPGPYIFPAWFTWLPGRPIDPNQPQDDNRYYWSKVREITGLELRFHDLRHTAITNALKTGMPDFAVRKIMGVSEKTMRRVYAHLEDELKNNFRGLFCAKFVQRGEKHANLRQIK